MIYIYLAHVDAFYLYWKIFEKMFRDVTLCYTMILLICNNLSTRYHSI